MPVIGPMAILEEGRGRHFDAGVLDAFRSIMPQVHDEVARRCDGEVEAVAGELLGGISGS